MSSADNLDSLVPGQTEAGRQGTAASSAEKSASKEQPGLTDTQEEPGGGQSRHQNKEVVHSVGDSETERLDMSSVTSDQDEAAKIAAAAAEMGEESIDPDEVMVIEPSPTQFNTARLPKTMESSVFKAVSIQAHASRAKIWKILAQMDKKVEELESLEQEDDDSDDDYAESLRKEVGEDMTKVKSTLASHTEFSNNIQLMCGYMMQTRDNIPQAGKIISDAKIAFDKSEKDEQIIEKKVSDWQAKNKKWLRGKGKKKKKESGAKTTEKESNTRWLETFAKELKPEGNLKNYGDLTSM